MAPQMAPAYVCVACLMRSVTQAIFSFILHNVFCLYFVSHQLFRSYRLFFFYFFIPAVNVKQMWHYWLKKKPFSHTRQRSNCVVTVTASNTNFTHELCGFKSIRQIVFLCPLSASQAATFHQHAAKRRSLLGKHSCSCPSADERLEELSLSSQQCDTNWDAGPRRIEAPPHSHLKWPRLMKSGDEAVPSTGGSQSAARWAKSDEVRRTRVSKPKASVLLKKQKQ